MTDPLTTTEPPTDSQERFLREIGLKPSIFFGVAGGGLFGNAEKIRDTIGTVSSDKFLNALKAGYPSQAGFVKILESDPALAESFKNALAKNDNLHDEISSLSGGKKGTNPLLIALHSNNISATDKAIIRQKLGLAFDDLAKDPSLGTERLTGTLKQELLNHETVGRAITVETFAADIKQAMGDDTAAIARFDAVLPTIHEDAAFTDALRDAMINDPTMTPENFEGLFAGEGQGSWDDFLKTIETPMQRSAMTMALRSIADNEDMSFEHLSALVTASLSGDQATMDAALEGLGIDKSKIAGDVFMDAFKEILRDPSQAGQISEQLLTMMVQTGQIDAQTAAMMHTFLGPMMGMLAQMIQPYADVYNKHTGPGGTELVDKNFLKKLEELTGGPFSKDAKTEGTGLAAATPGAAGAALKAAAAGPVEVHPAAAMQPPNVAAVLAQPVP